MNLTAILVLSIKCFEHKIVLVKNYKLHVILKPNLNQIRNSPHDGYSS